MLIKNKKKLIEEIEKKRNEIIYNIMDTILKKCINDFAEGYKIVEFYGNRYELTDDLFNIITKKLRDKGFKVEEAYPKIIVIYNPLL